MAVTLIADVAGPNSNSYITLVDAQTYISDERLAAPPPEWTSADLNTQAKALISATRLIDSHISGTKWRRDQALRFPRAMDMKPGSVWWGYGWDLMIAWPATPIIAKPVQQATVELALYLIARPSEDVTRERLQAQRVRHISLGRIQEAYQGDHNAIDACPEARQLLTPFGYGAPVRLG